MQSTDNNEKTCKDQALEQTDSILKYFFTICAWGGKAIYYFDFLKNSMKTRPKIHPF